MKKRKGKASRAGGSRSDKRERPKPAEASPTVAAAPPPGLYNTPNFPIGPPPHLEFARPAHGDPEYLRGRVDLALWRRGLVNRDYIAVFIVAPLVDAYEATVRELEGIKGCRLELPPETNGTGS